MLWKETDPTALVEAQGRYRTTIADPEATRHIEAAPPAMALTGVRRLEHLPIEVRAALLQDLQVEPIEALPQQGLRAELIEVVPVVPHQDHPVAPIEALVVPIVPVAA